MWKLSAKWVPKCLKANKKRQRRQSSEQTLEFFCAIQTISCRARLVTMDDTWLYHYDPETKQQSMEWRHSGSPRPQKFLAQKSAGKILALIFLEKRRRPLHLLSSKGPKYQRGLLLIYVGLAQLKDILKEKRHGKITNGGLFLQDNAPARRTLATQKKLAYLGFQYLDHPPSSPDLAPSDYNLFP